MRARKIKCPDCGYVAKRKSTTYRWACGRCHATGTLLDGVAVAVTRHVTFSGMFGGDEFVDVSSLRRGWRLNPWHPQAPLLRRRLAGSGEIKAAA